MSITKVYLLRVPLDSDYKHTMYFADAAAQTEYMIGRRTHTFEDFTYQRKDGVIRIPLAYDEAVKSNYVMYQNDSKWYYCFITGYEYKNDDQTNITIETDVLQTYMFDYTVLPSFVEREHVSDDTVGLHTIPENLEVGEYICQYKDQVTELQDAAIIMGVTEDITEDWDIGNLFTGVFEPVSGQVYDGIYSGVKYKGFTNSARGIQSLNYQIVAYASDGKNDAVKCLFMYPLGLITYEGELDSTQSILGSEKPKSINKIINHSAYDGYQPKNNKLYTFPYRYMLVSNNNGGSAVYQYELFDNHESSRFTIKGCLTPGGSIRLIPNNYKGQPYNNEEALNLGKYPICNWSSDEYTNWLTQNSVNIGLTVASGVGQIAAGVAMAVGTGGIGAAVGGGTIVGGVSTIAGQLAQIHQMSFASPQSRGNLNCGDVIAADNANTFYFQQMRIREENMRVIDDYFSMFGYKCNRVKIPNKDHRLRGWFTKTVDVNISMTNPIPQSDVEKIKNCYNSGVTFWKNNIKNYALDNPII